MVQPFAHAIIDDHRTAGRALVLATTTPDDMIRPLAERLGFDDVVATRYGVDGDGRYDGTIDGEFVWGINAPDLDALDQYALVPAPQPGSVQRSTP